MKRKHPPISSKVVVELRALIKLGYPDLTREEFERWGELLAAIPKEDYRREDFICTLDQAYCEHRGIERRFTRKTFAQ